MRAVKGGANFGFHAILFSLKKLNSSEKVCCVFKEGFILFSFVKR